METLVSVSVSASTSVVAIISGQLPPKFLQIEPHNLICGKRAATEFILRPVHVIINDPVDYRHIELFGIKLVSKISKRNNYIHKNLFLFKGVSGRKVIGSVSSNNIIVLSF
jgi:hypothetical protein